MANLPPPRRRAVAPEIEDTRTDNPDHKEAFYALLRAAVRAPPGQTLDQRTSAPPKSPR